jgi:hypothetical protein
LWEIVLILVIFMAGQRFGSRYIASYQQTAHGRFYQQFLGPAVLVGCGRAFRDPATSVPGLTEFLEVRTDAFVCDRLPADLPTRAPDFFQTGHRYLMTAIGWQWRLAGRVAWSALPPLYGVMFGMALCGVYALMRLVCGRLASAVGVVPFAISAHQLTMLPQLRDYAKAPLFLFLLFVTLQAVRPPFTAKRMLLWSAAFGALLGVSFGFRVDFALAIPVFAVTIVAFTPGPIRDHARTKAACLALAALMFMLVAWPVLTTYRNESNTSHVAFLGLTTAFDEPLAVTRPVYNLGSTYDDTTAFVVITSDNTIHGGAYAPVMDRQYERAGEDLLLRFSRHFPADVAIRALSSTLEVLDFPTGVNRSTPATPYAMTSPLVRRLYLGQSWLLNRLAGTGPVVLVLAILIVAANDFRAAIGLALLALYYCGSAATEFDFRNYFHLEFVYWWALVFVIGSTATAVVAFVRRRPLSWSRRSFFQAGLMAAGTAACLVLTLAMLRGYQQRHVAALVDQYLHMPRVPVPLSFSAAGGHTHVDTGHLWEGGDASNRFATRYLVAEFTSSHCQAASVPIRVTYEPDITGVAKTSRVPISSDGSTLRLIPVYRHTGYYRFSGFDLPDAYGGCLKSVSRLADLHDVPLLLDLTLDAGWRTTHLYQRLSKWEGDAEPAASRFALLPEDRTLMPVESQLVLPLDANIKPFLRPTPAVVGSGVSTNSADGIWFTPAPARTPSSHQVWLEFPSRPVGAAAALYVRGVVRKGGLRIGTTVDGRLTESRTVLSPGSFLLLMQVPEAGAYGIRVEDESGPEWRSEGNSWLRRLVWWTIPSMLSDDFELRQLGWVRLERPALIKDKV